MTKKRTFEQAWKKIQSEASDQFTTPEGYFQHFPAYKYEADKLVDVVLGRKCSDIPPLPNDFKLLKAVQESGKLNSHEHLLKDGRQKYLLDSARLLVTFGLESEHTRLTEVAKGILAGVYTELSPIRDMDFGNTMMQRDVKLFKEVNANHEMIKGMSQAGREAARRQVQATTQSPGR